MIFPHDAVPDGHIGAPHHLYVGILIAVLGFASAWDDQQRDPLLAAGGIGMTLFAFALVWPFYAALGALLTLFGLIVTAVGALTARELFAKKHAMLVSAGILIAADDAVEHAFGVWTPLDALQPLLPFTEQLLARILD
jgi:hypothetical protein